MRYCNGWAMLALGVLWLHGGEVQAQDLEPRRWTHLPIGLNVVGTGLGVTDGEIFLDPVLRIEDGSFELYSLTSSYLRTFEWLGKSSRIDFRLPYAYGRWEGILDGEPTSIRRHGFADPRVRLSMILYGSPPLRGEAFRQYRAENPVSTTIGAAVSLILPLGEYFPDRLINLGGNRYIGRAQLGLLHQRGPWQFEGTTTVSLYQDNDEFFGNTRLAQDPLWFVQGHIIRALARGQWISFSGGFSYGGESSINGVAKNNDDRTRYFSLGWGIPLTPRQSIRIAYINAETNVLLGVSSETYVLSWSLAWTR